MSAYAASVSVRYRNAKRLAPGVGMLVGTVDITNYNSTLAEITGITNRFRDTPTVILDGVSDNGYLGTWVQASEAIKCWYPQTAYSPTFTGTAEAAGLVVEEVQAVSSNTCTLDNLPAYIVAIDVTAGSTTGPFNVIPTGETPLTTECAVTFTSGVLTFVSSDAVTSVRVTYFPVREGTLFDNGNLVVDETVTAAAAKAALANRALCVQYVYDDTDNVRVALEPVGEAPSATHTGVIDILNGSSGTDIDSNAADEGNSLKVTYIKYSAAVSPSIFINDTDVTLSGTDPEQWDFIEEGNYPHLIVPGFGTQLVGEATATNVELIWSGPSASVGAGVPVWDCIKNQVKTQEATAITTLALPWFEFDATLFGPVTPAGTIGAQSAGVATELAADVDAGAFNFVAIGRLT